MENIEGGVQVYPWDKIVQMIINQAEVKSFPSWRSLPAKQNRLAVGKDQRGAKLHGLSSGRADGSDRGARGKDGICDGPGCDHEAGGRGPGPGPARPAARTAGLPPAGETAFVTAPPGEISKIALPGPDVPPDLA